MQRYRINYGLLLGLFVGSIVFVAGSYLLWRWQVDRKADIYASLASESLNKGELVEAFENQMRFVQLRPDDMDAMVELGNIAIQVIESKDTTIESDVRNEAIGRLDLAATTTGNPNLRQQLARIQLSVGWSPQLVLSTVEDLLTKDSNNRELREMQIQALFRGNNKRAPDEAFKIIGYDKQSDSFDDQKMIVGDEPDIYLMLAASLAKRDRDRDLAHRVIDRMIEVMPDSAEAYLRRAAFLQQIGEADLATESVEKAYELDPTDPQVLLQKGLFASRDEDSDAAYRYYSEGLEHHPDNLSFYTMLAQTELSRDNADKAMEIVERGEREFELQQRFPLSIVKLDILFKQNDVAGINKELDALQKLNISRLQPTIDFQRARLLIEEDQWVEASRALEKLLPLLLDEPNLRAQAGRLLGLCYEQQGRNDLALKAYQKVFDEFPQFKSAADGLARVNAKLNRTDPGKASTYESQVQSMLQRPEDQQDWSQIDDMIDQLAAEHELSDARKTLLKAQTLIQRKKFSEARELILEAAKLNPEDVNVNYAAVMLLAMDPDKGPATAMQLLDQVEQKLGVSLRSRISRASLLLSMRDENVVDQLGSLMEGTEDWSADDRTRLLTTIGGMMQRLGNYDLAIDYFRRGVELNPSSLPLRIDIFDTALQVQDDAAMADAQALVLDLVKDKNDPDYILIEVKRRIDAFTRGVITQEEAQAGRKLLDRALQERPEWHELYVVYGKLLFVLKTDLDLAVKMFDDALKYGPANMQALVIETRLLASQGQFKKAANVMSNIPESIRQRTLSGVESEVLLRAGKPDEAFASAQMVVAEKPENAPLQLWFAGIAAQSDHLDAAIAAVRNAVALEPSKADYWSELISLYSKTKDYEGVDQAMRESQLAIDAEFIPALTAKQYEHRGQWQSAEDIYLGVYENRLDQVSVNRRMAEFYLFWERADAKNMQRAVPFINRILRAGYRGEVPSDDPNVLWAREKAALFLTSRGTYRDSLKAQELLMQTAVDGKLSPRIERLLAQLLASRSEPRSKLEAIRHLSDLEAAGQLEKEDLILLAKLLNETNQWERCEKLLQDSIVEYRNDPDVWSTYIVMLINRGDYSRAENRLSTIKGMADQQSTYLELSAMLAQKRGDSAETRRVISSMVPDLSGRLTADQLKAVIAGAKFAERYGDYELADKLYRFYARRDPNAAGELMRFLALHGDAQEALGMMKRVFDDRMDLVLQLSLEMVRSRRATLGDSLDVDVDRFFSAALRDDPESIRRLLLKAELLDAQGKYDASIVAYEKVLRRTDVPEGLRAAAENNLGFLLALKGERLDEALSLVNSAIGIFGPVEDMLDTRAVVLMARGDNQQAIDEMTLATTTSQDPIKYYHLAKAYLANENFAKAKAAWERAEKLGFDPEKLPVLEQTDFSEVKQRIETGGNG